MSEKGECYGPWRRSWTLNGFTPGQLVHASAMDSAWALGDNTQLLSQLLGVEWTPLSRTPRPTIIMHICIHGCMIILSLTSSIRRAAELIRFERKRKVPTLCSAEMLPIQHLVCNREAPYRTSCSQPSIEEHTIHAFDYPPPEPSSGSRTTPLHQSAKRLLSSLQTTPEVTTFALVGDASIDNILRYASCLSCQRQKYQRSPGSACSDV